MSQQAIFRALRKGYSTPKEIAAYLKLSHMAVYHGLRRLADAGAIRRVPLHYALQPDAVVPDDMRGLHPNSQASLARTWQPRKPKSAPKRKPVPMPATTLEQCWPMAKP